VTSTPVARSAFSASARLAPRVAGEHAGGSEHPQ
jgi:hypothetical protein